MSKIINLKDIGNSPISAAQIIKYDHNYNYELLKTVLNEIDDDLLAHLASLSAHNSDNLVNTSGVAGSKISDALNNIVTLLNSHISSIIAHTSDSIVNESSVIGSKISDALDNLLSEINVHINSLEAHTSDKLTNISNVTGSKISDALDNLLSEISVHIASLNAHNSDNLDNNSDVTGAKITTALNDLKNQIEAIVVGGTDVDSRLSQALTDAEAVLWTNFKALQDSWQNRVVENEIKVVENHDYFFYNRCGHINRV